jgi:hypothetical protein
VNIVSEKTGFLAGQRRRRETVDLFLQIALPAVGGARDLDQRPCVLAGSLVESAFWVIPDLLRSSTIIGFANRGEAYEEGRNEGAQMVNAACVIFLTG